MKEAKKLYKEINPILKKINNKRIIKHEKLAEKVYKTTFENDISIIINYNIFPVTVNQNKIAAEDYYILKGEERSGR